MSTQPLLRLVHEALLDAKGQDIRVLDVRKFADFTDYMIIVNGTSTRHVLALTEKVRERLREHGQRPMGVEGEDAGDWVLIDCGDVIVHVMRPQTRNFYSLEKLWGSGPAAGALEL
jgi:ribosome-associated protein